MHDLPIIEVRGVSVAFRQYTSWFHRDLVATIHDLNFAIYSGEVVAVVGQSGAGKSLIAEAILGLLPKNAQLTGEILFRGQPIQPDQLRGKQIRYVPQGVSHIDPTMTVRGFVAQDGEPALPRLERFDIDDQLASRYPQELSGGQLRRVLLATSMGKHTELLIADEPTPGLHEEAARQVFDYVEELKTSGTSVLIITHDMVAAAEVADRLIVLKDGEVAADVLAGQIGEASGYAELLWRSQAAHDFWNVDEVVK